jgi:DNA polymerase-3 subunit beta
MIIISRDRLNSALALLKTAIAKASHLPILQHILVDVRSKEVVLRATDVEVAFEITLPCDGSETWQACLPGVAFVKLVKSLPKGELAIEFSEGSVWFSTGGLHTSIVSASDGVKNFPELPRPSKGALKAGVHTTTFKKALKLGSFVVSKDATKPTLSAVLLHLDKHRVRVVSTDGFRLGVATVLSETKLKDDARIIVPKRSVDLLSNLLQDSTNVELVWDNTTLFIDQPGLKFSTRLVTGNYPAYEKVLPAELPKRVIMDREVFLRTLRFVGLKKDDYNKNVRLFFEFPNLRTVFQHPDEGVNQATLPFTGEENPFELAFNIDYLTELLERLPGEEVVYQFKDEVGQGVFMSPSLEDFSFRYVLMPVRFANSATA